ncbi:unnamed protein product [Adineta steineri]|uniref:Metalloendopeptidase n=1 Tax=Adineta steineri TaxID=433720 RepID=A0A818M4J7_9BILA|nr:unnamed protein product [Adineta steineri]
MYQYIVLLLVCYSAVNAGPINLFLNATIDDQPNLEIIDGDIAFEAGKAPALGSERNAYIQASKWTGGSIPYLIDGGVYTAAQIQTIKNAMLRIEQQTSSCIRFVPRTNQPTWIRIFPGSGCWSYMGRTKTSGAQDLSIATPGCAYQDIVMHELIHAAGFAHEQTRPDRESHVTINYNNIQSGTESNFQRYLTTQADTLGRAYDYASIMHYKSTAFSKNGQATITAKNGVSAATLGSSKEMTTLDVQKLRAYYGCA